MKKQTRREIFLGELERITPWAALEQSIAPFYPNSGKTGSATNRLTRMYIAQQCFNLSDEGMEEALDWEGKNAPEFDQSKFLLVNAVNLLNR